MSAPDFVDRILLATPSYRPRGFALAEFGDAGGKGAGLLRLPPSWYPRTLVIGPHVHVAWSAGLLADSFLSDAPNAGEFQRAILALAGKKARLFLRSSAAREGIEERGTFESVEVAPTLADVEQAIVRAWQRTDDDTALGFLIQPLLDVRGSGHLSNEYRVSRDATSWVFETEVGGTGQPRRWRVVAALPIGDGPLHTPVVAKLEPNLRSVGKRLSDLPSRHHLEWVWDGDELWIVQADRVPPQVGPAPGDAWFPNVGSTIEPHRLQRWQLLEGELTEAAGWPKAEAIKRFIDAGLPTANVYMLAGHDVVKALAEGEVVPGMAEDLEVLCSGHVVVRTDIRGDVEGLMLPKTTTIADPSIVTDFLTATARGLADEGVPFDDISFLVHRYLRARACAWTRAVPGDPFVEVDSMWGTPDGLSWLPHDSSWVNTDTTEVRRSIDGKTAFLDIIDSNNWTYRESPTEWIWRASMTEDQLRNVAAGARRLADQAGEPVLTMWFIGMLDGADVECLPWFQFSAPVGSEDERHSVSPASVREVVATMEQLLAFKHRSGSSHRVLRVSPNADLIRDKKFVETVIEVARSTDATVEIVGSPLAHPFYMLRKAGIPVSCVDQFAQPDTTFNKLVRDNIVTIIENNGETVVSYTAKGAERERLLRLKLLEESIELLHASSDDEMVEELADVEEVLDTLRVAMNIRRDDLRNRRKEKRAKRGGFSQGRVLVRTGRPKGPPESTLDIDIEDDAESRSWQVQQTPSRVTLSTLPPLPGEQRTYVLRLGGRPLRIEYRGSQVEIRFDDEEASEDSAQIALFDAPQ